jgi:ABC-type transport system involved in multi-copper enzyme maturation permease subunit
MLTTIRYVLLTALRDRLFFGLLAGVAVAAYIAAVLGGTALVETQEMTISLSAGAARMILAVGLIVFVCFHLRYAFDTKEMDVFLSRPISRRSLVIAYWLGFVAVALLLLLPIIGLIAWLGILNLSGFWLWSASLAMESLLVVAIALFASVTLRSGVTAMLTSLGLYTIMRMMGFFVATANSTMLNQGDMLVRSMRWLLETISIFIPRLDLYGNAQWLIYGGGGIETLGTLFAQIVVFIPLLLVATMIDLQRRQF